MKRKIFLDMDGVVVDFDGYAKKHGLTADQIKAEGYRYGHMEPMPGAIEGVRALLALGYDVFLATKPATGIAAGYAAKAQWVFDHLPELQRHLIITHDKGVLGAEWDVLVDDRPWRANCFDFEGALVHFSAAPLVAPVEFETDHAVTDWPALLELLPDVLPADVR